MIAARLAARLAVRVAVLPALLVTACTTTEHFAFRTKSERGLTQVHGVATVDFDCPPGTDLVRVAFDANGQGGSLRATLTDPDGAVRWTDQTSTGTHDVEMCFDARAGVWTCELSFEGFSGGYGFEITSRTEPSIVDSIAVTDVRIVPDAKDTGTTTGR